MEALRRGLCPVETDSDNDNVAMAACLHSSESQDSNDAQQLERDIVALGF